MNQLFVVLKIIIIILLLIIVIIPHYDKYFFSVTLSYIILGIYVAKIQNFDKLIIVLVSICGFLFGYIMFMKMVPLRY
jgi:hypothetical protein